MHTVKLDQLLVDTGIHTETGGRIKRLERLIGGREHLALVFDEFGSIVSLVTLEDLVETALGVEIVDETDVFEDLQEEARRRYRERLQWPPLEG